MKTACRASRIVDGVSEKVVRGGYVLVEDGRIIAVERDLATPRMCSAERRTDPIRAPVIARM